MKKLIRLLLIITLFFLISGCGAFLVSGAMVGAGGGTYLYINGELQGEYQYPLDTVWAACEKTMADVHAINVERSREIGSGTMSAIINNEHVKLTITYNGKSKTIFWVRVGVWGDKIASQFLYDKIADNLSKNRSVR